MKAISIRQPWAWAIFHGKPVENRDWSHSYRGPLLIHAAKTIESDDYFWIRDNFPDLVVPPIDSWPRGCFVGKVQMVGCVRNHPSPWFFGPWGHVYKNPEEFEHVIPWRGMPGIFDVPREVICNASR